LERKGLILNKEQRAAMLKAKKDGRTSIVADSIYKASFGGIQGTYDFEDENIQQGFLFNEKINYQVINSLITIDKKTVHKNVSENIKGKGYKLINQTDKSIQYERTITDFFDVDVDLVTDQNYDLNVLVTYDFKDNKVRTTYERILLTKGANQNIIIDNYFFELGEYSKKRDAKYKGLVEKLIDLMNKELKNSFDSW
tara:strand:+ start:4751 stop:5341 length:591 start_codon:yes stop_codon:yes gene_type:complete